MTEKLRDCPDCAAKPGEVHSPNCDVERCSVCGRQKLGCSCEDHDPAFAHWTGIWPGEAEAKLLGIDLNTLYSDGIYKYLFVKPKIPVVQLRVDRHLESTILRRRGNHRFLLQQLSKMPKQQQLELFRILQDMEMEIVDERRKRKQGRMW